MSRSGARERAGRRGVGFANAGGPNQGLNENYGRELLELHTLGVDGGYTQADVINVARAFTGWTIFDPQRYGEFQFNPQMHDRGEKVVLGHKFPRGGGEEEGVKIIDLLAAHPSTARFISRKLAQRFVADDPPQAARRSDGRHVHEDRRRPARGHGNTALLARIHVRGRVAGKGQDAIRAGGERAARTRRGRSDTTALAQRLIELGMPLYGRVDPERLSKYGGRVVRLGAGLLAG